MTRTSANVPVAGALIASAAVHIPVIPEHLQSATYMGIAFTAFVYAALAVSAWLLVSDRSEAPLAAAGLAGAAVLTYAATRFVAFPALADDVGNWLEPLGVLAVAAELLTVATAVLVLRSRRTGDRRPSTS